MDGGSGRARDRLSRRIGYGLLTAAFASAALPVPAAAQEVDLTLPEVHVPGPITADATSALGAQVFFIVTATNNVAPLSLSCTGPSGGIFPIGTSTVTCRAFDVSGNKNAAIFTITVRAGAATAALTSASALVLGSALDQATQGDLIVLLRNIATPVSLSRKCAKVDPTKDRADLTNGKLGNRDSCLEKDVADAQKVFTDFVADAGTSNKGTPPTISPSAAGPLLAAAQLLATATVVGATNTPPVLAFAPNVTTKLPPSEFVSLGFTSVLYTDRTNPPPTLVGPSCNPPSGTQFPVGKTTITCSASTTGGTTTGIFTVTVNPR